MLAPHGNIYDDKYFRNAFEPLTSTAADPFERKVVVEKATPDEDKLDDLVVQTKRVLYKAKSVFPFDFFPNIVCVDENKVNIIHKIFFFSEQIFPIAISDINNVTVTTDLFFASLTLEIGGMEVNPEPIKFMWKKDALMIRRIIFGLMECKKEDINLSCFPVKELLPKLIQIGMARQG